MARERTMELFPGMRCVPHNQPFSIAQAGENGAQSSCLHCQSGCRVPVIAGIPRFVPQDNYASAFGHQWNAYRKTQLDSYTGTTITRSRLERCLGGSMHIVRGQRVLEAGCGAGRFTEILLSAGARVFACDLSNAVEANRQNCGQAPDYFVCQADIMNLPVEPASFDVVICLGVIQHTPNPEQTIARLSSYVRPGGLLVIDHYSYGAEDMTPTRQVLRRFLLRTSPRFSLAFTRGLVALLWPLHRWAWSARNAPLGRRLRNKLLYLSPLVDYHDSYSELGPSLLYAWAALDTHDALTDRYKFKRTVEEIAACLQECDMTDIEASYGGNGVEARARKKTAAAPIAQPVEL
jgi:SAM-dependent methyltransferase